MPCGNRSIAGSRHLEGKEMSWSAISKTGARGETALCDAVAAGFEQLRGAGSMVGDPVPAGHEHAK